MSRHDGKKVKKLAVHFDPVARREYLTGFRKRKKIRKAKAKLKIEKQEKERLKEVHQQKRGEIRKKLEQYGLEKDDDGVGVVVDKSASASLLDQHPDHVVVINMQPNFGLSLSSMLSEENPKEKPNLSHAKGSSHCRITNK